MPDEHIDDLTECWCCGGLSERSLCPDCDDAGCTHFGDECKSDHIPVGEIDDA